MLDDTAPGPAAASLTSVPAIVASPRPRPTGAQPRHRPIGLFHPTEALLPCRINGLVGAAPRPRPIETPMRYTKGLVWAPPPPNRDTHAPHKEAPMARNRQPATPRDVLPPSRSFATAAWCSLGMRSGSSFAAARSRFPVFHPYPAHHPMIVFNPRPRMPGTPKRAEASRNRSGKVPATNLSDME